jgi:hypothetical protein
VAAHNRPLPQPRGGCWIVGWAQKAETAPAGRLRMHDLVRPYARQLSDEHADADSREQARDPAAPSHGPEFWSCWSLTRRRRKLSYFVLRQTVLEPICSQVRISGLPVRPEPEASAAGTDGVVGQALPLDLIHDD